MRSMRWTGVNVEQVLAVRCPTCGAAPGQRCESNAGGLRGSPHPDRLTSAINTIQDQAVTEKSQARVLRAHSE